MFPFMMRMYGVLNVWTCYHTVKITLLMGQDKKQQQQQQKTTTTTKKKTHILNE